MAVSVVFLISILISGVKKKGEKQWDSYAICPVCASKNDLSRDTCVRCGYR